jgi:hypothetical protein
MIPPAKDKTNLKKTKPAHDRGIPLIMAGHGSFDCGFADSVVIDDQQPQPQL